jgi:hypothetical protein
MNINHSSYLLSIFMLAAFVAENLEGSESQYEISVKSIVIKGYEDCSLEAMLGNNGEIVSIKYSENGHVVNVPIEELGGIDDVNLQSIKIKKMYDNGKVPDHKGDGTVRIYFDYGAETVLQNIGDKSYGSELRNVRNAAMVKIDKYKYISLECAVPDKLGNVWRCFRKPLGLPQIPSGLFESGGNPWSGAVGKWK